VSARVRRRRRRGRRRLPFSYGKGAEAEQHRGEPASVRSVDQDRAIRASPRGARRARKHVGVRKTKIATAYSQRMRRSNIGLWMTPRPSLRPP